jgi:hypothetical protein
VLSNDQEKFVSVRRRAAPFAFACGVFWAIEEDGFV